MESDNWDKRGSLIVRIDNNQKKTLEHIIMEDIVKNAKIELGGGYRYFKETEEAINISILMLS